MTSSFLKNETNSSAEQPSFFNNPAEVCLLTKEITHGNVAFRDHNTVSALLQVFQVENQLEEVLKGNNFESTGNFVIVSNGNCKYLGRCSSGGVLNIGGLTSCSNCNPC